MNYRTKMDYYLTLLEASLPTYLPSKDVPQQEVIEAMEYALMGGKRVRGIMMLAFYEFFGGKYVEKVLPFAAAIEMIHAYSLIHDDLPCMDDDDLRRGKPSCHIQYGEATALLAGDGLLTLAFETLTLAENVNNFGAETVLATIRILSLAAGVNGMIGGQVMDLDNEERDITAKRLEDTDKKKTGALFMASTLMGSVLAGAVTEQLSVAETFAKKIGLAFQIQDDILDVTSDDETLGKPTGSDAENKKNTYTSLYGLGKAKDMVEQLAFEAKSILVATGRDASFLNQFTDQLTDRKY